MNFDILTDSLIVFQDGKGSYFYVSSNGTGSIRFGFYSKVYPSIISQKYMDSEEYILKKHLTITS